MNCKTFVYTNHKTGEKLIIEAQGILEADVEFEKKTGINPAKAPYVGCAPFGCK